MNINSLFQELCESNDNISTKVVPQFIPKEKWNDAFEDIVKRYGRSKFGNLTVNDMFKDPSEGWFFHYSKYLNKYVEGQYSFQFVQTFGFNKNLGIKNIVSDKDVSWNNGNFSVDSINKQVVIEKAWAGERLATGHIENMDDIKTALSIASKLHPEIIDYKFNYPRMGLKKVSDVLNISSIGEGNSDITLFWGATEDALRIANKSKYENIICWFDTALAKGEIRVHQYKNPVETGKAIIKLKFKSNDKRLTKKSDGSVKVSYVTKSDIVSYKASSDFDINSKILYEKYQKYNFLEEIGAHIYIVKDIEAFKSKYDEIYQIGSGSKSRYRNNFAKRDFLYEVVNNGRTFFAATSDVSDKEIIFSICNMNPDIFYLRTLNLVDYSNDNQIIREFILNENMHPLLKTLFENLFNDRYKDRIKEIEGFIRRTQEIISN